MQRRTELGQLMAQRFLLTPCKVELLLSPCIHFVPPSSALPQGKIPESAISDQDICHYTSKMGSF